MYTSGHMEICNEAFKLMGEKLRKNFLDDYSGDVSIKNMIIGLKYPDFPCGKYKFDKGRVKMTKTLCNIFKLIDDIIVVPNLYSVSYSSHNGYYSIWHAMSYNPNRTVFETARDITDHIMALCKLAIMDETLDTPGPNSFWLGFALHAIMDAYSPAHIVRDNTKSKINYEKVLVSPKVKKEIKETKYVNLLKEHIASLSQEQRTEDGIKNILEEFYKENGVSKVNDKKDLSQLANLFVFHHNELDEINKIRSIVAKTAKTALGYIPYDDDIYKKYVDTQMPLQIINFYYYPTQTVMFHKRNDLITSVKEHKMYNQCVLDCYVILRLYKEALGLLNNAGSRMAKLEIMYSFLHKVYKYLVNKTLKVHPDYFKARTGPSI
jgi:hypothetical protein